MIVEFSIVLIGLNCICLIVGPVASSKIITPSSRASSKITRKRHQEHDRSGSLLKGFRLAFHQNTLPLVSLRIGGPQVRFFQAGQNTRHRPWAASKPLWSPQGFAPCPPSLYASGTAFEQRVAPSQMPRISCSAWGFVSTPWAHTKLEATRNWVVWGVTCPAS